MPNNFEEYALSPSLTPDETYTVELLIEWVRHHFDSNYYDEFMERGDERESPDYEPHFDSEHVIPATREIQTLTWLSFQRQRRRRQICDLSVLHYIPTLTALALTDNNIDDISPLASCSQLQKLTLKNNPVRDISTLEQCRNLEELDLHGCPIENFSPLESLPSLLRLELSIDQLPAFKYLTCLPTLRELIIWYDPNFEIESFDSFEYFPEMPELRSLSNANVDCLNGIEKFTKLENLINLSGSFTSLEPLAKSKALTHANIYDSRVNSIEPLAHLYSLRDLYLATEAPELDLSPLQSLPALHEVVIKCNNEEPADLDKLRANLESWDVEFLSPSPRHTPSLELEIVDQKTFDYYDTEVPYNITKEDTNECLLSSELYWLDAQIQDALSIDFELDEDFFIPDQWGRARSRTVVLLSQEAIEAFPRLALAIQQVLANAKNDWIIYFQSEDNDFIVWIYPDKIVTTSDCEYIVNKLIQL